MALSGLASIPATKGNKSNSHIDESINIFADYDK
jgi:hypothetical protein